jgi:hypothetical protein
MEDIDIVVEKDHAQKDIIDKVGEVQPVVEVEEVQLDYH